MSLRKTFERRLSGMLHRRTDRLLGLIKRKPGPRKDFTRHHREDGIAELQSLAGQILRKDVVPGHLRAITTGTRLTRLGGRGLENRFQRMCDWAESNLRGPIIYSFWRGNRCLYVGKGESWRRLRSYRRDILLATATSLRVRMIAGKSHLAMAECMSIHLYEPRYNINQSSKPKYSKKCPICQTNLAIREELRSLFRMR
ncbi:MAG: hypothetical protein ACKOCT_20695 [Alphaproteobacteria bacterium]